MRPWPMPSVIELPSAFKRAVRVIVVDRRAHRIGEEDSHVRLRSFSAMPTPASVPPVPTEATKASTLPPVCSQISGPVVS